MTTTTRSLALLALGLALIAGCTSTRLTTQAQLPPPLIEQLPVRVGVLYSQEFREYIHKETRGSMDYEVNLGPAHVVNLDWLLKAMFREIVHVEDPAAAASITPPLAFVLEPKFEEYSFLTPKDVAGEAFIVTIRYLLTLYDHAGARVDSFTFTGYGREKAGSMSGKEPLAAATQRAMRDAGAKIAVELTDQDSVRLLLRGAGSPLPASPPAPPNALVAPAPPAPRAQITTTQTPAGSAPASQAPAEKPEGAQQEKPEETSAGKPEEKPEETPAEKPEETPPAAPPPGDGPP
jgi:hypothetical protein